MAEAAPISTGRRVDFHAHAILPSYADGLKRLGVDAAAEEDITYLKELYTPHPLVGVMAQNTKTAKRDAQVWMKNAPKD